MEKLEPKQIFSLDAEQAFRVFLDAAPDAIVVVDNSGHIVMANKLAEIMFGHSREELLSQRVEILLPEKSRAAHVGYRTGYFQDPKIRPMGEGRELLGRRKDGTEFPIEISLSPLRTGQGTLAISIIRDIAQRKQLEAKFRGLLESAPDGIVVVNTLGRIVIINSQTEKLFGYARDELIGQPIEILVPSRFKDAHIKYRDGYIQHPRTRPMGAGRALTGRKKDGTEFPVEISLSPLETEQGTLVTSIVRDITERRHAEERLQASLREKEALLKEIHHRVKNNLQVTSSLLRLQSDYIQDPAARDMFAESQNRIRSMALVHEKLYKSSDLSRINFADYIDSLASLLFRSFGVDTGQIKFQLDHSNIFLSVETAVPCGLIINELLSNCFKHAFKDMRGGEIRVEVCLESEHTVEFTVADNGLGLPKGFDLEKMDTLGLQLVRTLVKQLDGTIEIHGEAGTSFTVRFSKEREHV